MARLGGGSRSRIGPFLGYLTSRSIGVPGDRADVGNWGYWVDPESLIVEAALVVLCAAMLLPTARRLSPSPEEAPVAGQANPVRGWARPSRLARAQDIDQPDARPSGRPAGTTVCRRFMPWAGALHLGRTGHGVRRTK